MNATTLLSHKIVNAEKITALSNSNIILKKPDLMLDTMDTFPVLNILATLSMEVVLMPFGNSLMLAVQVFEAVEMWECDF